MYRLLIIWLLIILYGCEGSSSINSDSNSSSGQSTLNIGSSSEASSSSSAPGNPILNKTGREHYLENNCQFCHNEDGQKPEQPIVLDNWNKTTLSHRISHTMPPQNQEACVGVCAEKIAEYLISLREEENCNTPIPPLPRRLRLLTNREYANTVNDLLGRNDGDELIRSFESDAIVAGFDNNAEGSSVSINRMDAYWSAARTIAQSQLQIERLLNCGQNYNQNEDAQTITRCADVFVPNFGEKVFRRLLTDDEIQNYKELFKTAPNRLEGARYTIQAFLSSANFLYRTELGALENSHFELTDYEIANLLSYTFWGTMPDTELFNKAREGRLKSSSERLQQVRRLLRDDRAKPQMAHFGKQWINVQNVSSIARDENLFPSYNGNIGWFMEQELEHVLQELLATSNGYTVSDIYQFRFTFLNNTLSDYYGIPGANNRNFVKVDFTDQRQGLLSLGAISAKNGSFKENDPIHRGLLIRRNLLCQEFGVPPANIGEVEPINPNRPLRERLRAHSDNEACSSCHEKIDPLGFAFEHYNAVGLYRVTEGNNLSINASGSLIGIESMAGTDEHPFSHLNDLSDILANAGKERATYCLTEQFARYMSGIKQPNPCAVKSHINQWKTSSDKIIDLWPTMTAADSYLIRQ